MMMRVTNALALISFLWFTGKSSAFLFVASRTVPKPELAQLTKAPPSGTVLNIRLDVGKEGESRLSIKDLLIELLPDVVESHGLRSGHPNLPVTGKVSSGVRRMKVLQPGHYANMNGPNRLDPINGCWEIVWRDGAIAGSLVCNFELTHDHRRNDAVLSKGQHSWGFPVWTRAGLDTKQTSKRNYENLKKQYEDEYYSEVEKMEATDNLFMKAWHFAVALEAFQRHRLIPHREISLIPLDDELIPLDNGLLLSNKGLVWTKDDSHYFATNKIVLGSALAGDARSVETKDDVKLRP